MIEVIRGDSHKISVTFKEDGVVYDLTDGTVFFTVNASANPPSDADALIAKEVTSFDEPTSGNAIIELTPQDTDLEPGSYWYDIQLVDAQGNVVSKPKDRFKISSDVTRRTT